MSQRVHLVQTILSAVFLSVVACSLGSRHPGAANNLDDAKVDLRASMAKSKQTQVEAADSAAVAPSARILEYGRYQETPIWFIPRKNVSGDVLVNLPTRKHIETTRIIPAQIGEIWGYRVQWQNLPKMKPYEFRTEVHYPPIKQPDGRILTMQVQQVMMDAGTTPPDQLFGWTFLYGFEYELVPGEWTRKLFIDKVEVANMVFKVVSEIPAAGKLVRLPTHSPTR